MCLFHVRGYQKHYFSEHVVSGVTVAALVMAMGMSLKGLIFTDRKVPAKAILIEKVKFW